MEPDDELGNIWAFYYFFYNKQDKRVLFFTARAVTLMASLDGLGSQDFESSEQLSSGHEVPFIME